MNDKEQLDLALTHHRAGQLREAETIYRQILRGALTMPIHYTF